MQVPEGKVPAAGDRERVTAREVVDGDPARLHPEHHLPRLARDHVVANPPGDALLEDLAGFGRDRHQTRGLVVPPVPSLPPPHHERLVVKPYRAKQHGFACAGGEAPRVRAVRVDEVHATAAAQSVPLGASFAFEMALRSLDERLGRINALDTKSGVLIAADGVIVGLLAGERSIFARAPAWIGVGVLVTIGASLILSLLAFTTRRYESAPRAEAVIRLMAAEPDWLRWRFLENMQEALINNRGKLRTKTRLLSASLTSLIGGSTLLGGYLIVSLLLDGA